MYRVQILFISRVVSLVDSCRKIEENRRKLRREKANDLRQQIAEKRGSKLSEVFNVIVNEEVEIEPLSESEVSLFSSRDQNLPVLRAHVRNVFLITNSLFQDEKFMQEEISNDSSLSPFHIGKLFLRRVFRPLLSAVLSCTPSAGILEDPLSTDKDNLPFSLDVFPPDMDDAEQCLRSIMENISR